MTNEELAVAVAQGQDELQLQLWEQIEDFVRMRAHRAFVLCGGRGGVTIEDLIQQGYIAMRQAVTTYNAEQSAFLTYFDLWLRSAFAEACDYRTAKRDPLNSAFSLDAPVDGGEDETSTYLDFLVDPSEPYEDADQRVYIEQLHNALDAALDGLPPKRASILRAMYWQGKTNTQIAAERGVSIQNIGSMARHGIDDLRRSSAARSLQQFLDERTDFYSGTGRCSFEANGSSVERAVIRREGLLRRWEKENRDTA